MKSRRAPFLGWAILGAALASLLVAPFKLQPGWLWGMGAGMAGGMLGIAAWRITTLRWRPALRMPAAFLVFGGGLFLIWMLAGSTFLVEWVIHNRSR